MSNDSPQKKSQRDRFIETARQLGADEDEVAFKAKLATIARQKPKDDEEKDVVSTPPTPSPDTVEHWETEVARLERMIEQFRQSGLVRNARVGQDQLATARERLETARRKAGDNS